MATIATLSGVQCGAVLRNAGVSTTNLVQGDGTPIMLKPHGWQVALFEPKAFGAEESKKLGLLLSPDEELASAAAELDCWAVNFIAANSLAICGRQMSIGQVGSFYKPVLREPRIPGGPKTVKIKVITKGAKTTAVYLDTPGGRTQADLSTAPAWRLAMIRPVVKVHGIYSSTNGCGLTLEATGVLFSGQYAAETIAAFDPAMFD